MVDQNPTIVQESPSETPNAIKTKRNLTRDQAIYEYGYGPSSSVQ